jgi:8-oxo-dGTP pyrophosphatase MutT (NUDIX family)
VIQLIEASRFALLTCAKARVFVAGRRLHRADPPQDRARSALLPGASAVVVDDAGRILLAQRADFGYWSIIGGVPEPGEEPAAAVVREVYEETGVHVVRSGSPP